MKISNLLIGVVIFTVMIISGSSLLLISNSVNPNFLDQNDYNAFNAVFNQQAEMNNTMTRLRQSMVHDDATLMDIPSLIYNMALFLVQSVWGSVQFLFTTISSIPTILGFSAELAPFIWGLIAVLTIAIILAIISATQYREL